MITNLSGAPRWMLPDGVLISHPQPVQVEDVQYPKSIFSKWDTEALNLIGIYPITTVNIDDEFYESTGFTDVITDGVVTRTYTGTAKYVASEVRRMIRRSVKYMVMGLHKHAKDQVEYYLDFDGANPDRADWQDYITDLKAIVPSIRVAIQNLSSYTEAVEFYRNGWKQLLPAIPEVD